MVLPFHCPGADTKSEILCAGLLDTITAKLAELQRFRTELSVVPTSEIIGQRVTTADEARRVFGVDLVISGSVLREGDTTRIPLQLIDTQKLRQIRSRTLTTENSADFVLQDQVVATIEVPAIHHGRLRPEAKKSTSPHRKKAKSWSKTSICR